MGLEPCCRPAPPQEPRFGVCTALALGLAITAAQVVQTCLLSGKSTAGEAYAQLLHWDGGWYKNVVLQGYFTTSPMTTFDCGNVAFFPAYPLLARALKNALGLSVDLALLLAAQAACWGFWTYLLLFFRDWGLSARRSALGVLLVLSHPASFFLVAAYTESLYLLGLLGFLYWAGARPTLRDGWLAAGHGFIMTATRLVGLPLVIYPLLQAWLAPADRSRGLLRRSLAPLLLGAVASLGCLLFFAYCQWRFGRWDLYMETSAVGWNVRPNYLALLVAKTYHVHFPHPREGYIDPDFLSRLSVPVLLLVFLGLFALEWRLARSVATGWRQRVGFYAGAWLMFYVPVCGHAARNLCSMLRFTLCVHVLLVLALCHLLACLGPIRDRRGRRALLLLAAGCLFSFSLEIAMAYRFTHWKWVA